MPSRNLSDLYWKLEVVVRKALEIAKEKDLKVLIICTYRSNQEQKALYSQGREDLDIVNSIRLQCGLAKLTEKENKKVITWTLKSYHSTEPKSMAFDFCIFYKNHIIWNIKADVNDNEIDDYKEFAEICKSLDNNIEWGGDWKKKDWGHIQWKDGRNIDQNKVKNIDIEQKTKRNLFELVMNIIRIVLRSLGGH